MAPEQWVQFTDFGLTAFDSAGQQVETTPLNYARGRQDFDVPARLAGHPVVFELLEQGARDVPQRLALDLHTDAVHAEDADVGEVSRRVRRGRRGAHEWA